MTTEQPICLTPQVLGGFYSTFERPKEKPIGAWYKLNRGAYCDLPLWSSNTLLLTAPPTVRQRKRRHSEVD